MVTWDELRRKRGLKHIDYIQYHIDDIIPNFWHLMRLKHNLNNNFKFFYKFVILIIENSHL